MIDIPVLKWIVVCSNGLILAFLIVLICEHYYAGNSLKSWAFLFYIVSFGWLVLKGIFWFLTTLSGRTWEAFQFYVLYWVPVPLEICSFMLVPLFFVHIIHPRKWKRYKIYIRPIYIVLTCGLTALTIIWSLLAAVSLESQHRCIRDFLKEHADDDDVADDECFSTEYTADIFRFITASCFLFLSSTQGWFGLKLHHITDWQQLRMIATQKESLTYLNIFLCFSFLSRVVYQILAMFWDFGFADVPLDGATDIPFPLFFIIILWDYLPTLLLLLYVVSPSLQGGIFASRARSGSRNLSMDESDLYNRERSDTMNSSDGGEDSVDLSDEGFWSMTKNVLLFWKTRMGGGGDVKRNVSEHRNMYANYGTPDYDGYDGDFDAPQFRGLNHNPRSESSSLMSSNYRHRSGMDERPGDSRTTVTVHRTPPPIDRLKRFQQPPLLPIVPQNNLIRGGYPYQPVQQSSPALKSGDRNGHTQGRQNHSRQNPRPQHHQTEQQQQQQQRLQRQLYTQVPAQNCWGGSNNNNYYDPDLYAFSGIPQSRSNGGSSGDNSLKIGVSPLDLRLQRDTSSQKFASYAPHAPPTQVTESVDKVASAGGKTSTIPSNLDNALGAFKSLPKHLRVVTQDFNNSSNMSLDRLMSPSAMSHESPSDGPTEFTLASRLSSYSTGPHENIHNRSTNLHSETKLHHESRQDGQGGRQKQGQLRRLSSLESQDSVEDRGGLLSSKPVLRNSSGNFLNLVNLVHEEQRAQGIAITRTNSDDKSMTSSGYS